MFEYKGKKYNSYQEFLADDSVPFAEKRQITISNPAFAEQFKQLEAQKAQGALQGKIADSIGLLNNLGLTAIALDQIRSANRGSQGLVQPGIPSPPPLSPEITQRLYEAQRGVVDPYAVLNPARQEIQDAYTSGLNQAKIASGGQAGSYQALANLANVERMRAGLGLAPIAQLVKLQNQQMLNDMSQLRAQERQNQYNQRLQATELGLDQYNRNAEAVGALGAAGRYNLVDALGRTADSLSGLSQYYLPFDSNTKSYMDNAFNRAEQRARMSQPYSGVYRPTMPNYGVSPNVAPTRVRTPYQNEGYV